MIGPTLVLNGNSLPTVNKLWRILYSPRSVFDELSSNLQIAFPLVAVLATVALCSFILHDNAFSAITSPLGWLIYMVVIGTGFFIVGKVCKTEQSWSQWFGFAAWMQVPLVLITVLNVCLTLLNVEAMAIPLFTIGEWKFGLETSTIWWVWSYIISFQGLRSWTPKGTGGCIGLALVPHALLVLPLVLLFLMINAFLFGAASQM